MSTQKKTNKTKAECKCQSAVSNDMSALFQMARPDYWTESALVSYGCISHVYVYVYIKYYAIYTH